METIMSPTKYLDDVLEGNESEEDLCADDEGEEKITNELAILSWLQTFSQVKNVGGVNVHSLIEKWYDNEEISK